MKSSKVDKVITTCYNSNTLRNQSRGERKQKANIYRRNIKQKKKRENRESLCSPTTSTHRKEKVTHPMREQMKRLLSAAAALCMLPGMAVLPSFGYTASAETAAVVTAAASAVSYQQSAALAALVQRIEEGACGLYLDNQEWTEPEEPLAVGTNLNTQQRYYVRTTTGLSQWGKQCYIYSQGVYSQLFDALPLNGNSYSVKQPFNGNDDILLARTVLQGPAEITPQVLAEAKVMPGAYLRTTTDTETGKFNGSAGHSLIILGYDDTTITVLEGNANGMGAIAESTISYEEFAHRFTTGWNRTVTHIIQPDADVYEKRFGLTYSYAAPPAPAEENAAPVTTAAETATAPVTAAAVTTTTAAVTTSATTAATTTTAAVTTAAASTVLTTTTTAAPQTTILQPRLLASAAPAQLLPAVYTADLIRVTRKTTKVALFLPDAKRFTWSSSDTNIVQVDENGKVTVRQNGKAVITAASSEMRYAFPIEVQVVSWAELGDINLDGSVDPADATLALQIYVDTLVGSGLRDEMTDVQLAHADVDDNGEVSVEDAQNILRFYVEYTLSESGLSPMETWARLLGME